MSASRIVKIFLLFLDSVMLTTSAEQLTIQCCTASRKLDFAKNCLDKFLEKPNLINISLGLRDLIKSTLEDCVILECGVI